MNRQYPNNRRQTWLSRRVFTVLALVAALSFFGITYAFAYPAHALAWEDCPKGLVNDPYPGRCGRYVDTNDDQICDLSQPQPAESATTGTLAATPAATGEPPTGDCPLGPCAGCGACFGLSVPATTTPAAAVTTLAETEAPIQAGPVTTSPASPATVTEVSPLVEQVSGSGSLEVENTAQLVSADPKQGTSFFTHYLVSPIALGFFIIYGITFLLYKTKRMRTATHRKIWNVLLLGTFLTSGLFGLLLAIQLDYPLPFRIPFDLLFWHVEAGIAMTLISLFHLGWHFSYYRNLFRRARKQYSAARAGMRALEAEEGRSATKGCEQHRVGTGSAWRDPLPRTTPD